MSVSVDAPDDVTFAVAKMFPPYVSYVDRPVRKAMPKTLP